MAQFSLSLINNRGTTVLTDYDTMAGKTAGLTFDERLNLSVDGSTLDFSMLKYLYEGSQKVVNTPTVSITYGSVIKCIMNGRRYDFAVTDINYQFLAENLQLQFSAQDYFQFETSKLGIGYSITADTTDPDYFGAQPIDAWARKIINDNNLRWGYVPINQANREWINTALTKSQKQLLFNTDTDEDFYWEHNSPDLTLNQWVSFECSDSSAYNALKQLASEHDLVIVVDYSAHNFWFAPAKSVVFNGYYFNPNNNLQQFSIRGSAQNLVTVLNVTGPHDLNDQEITLVPQLPTEIITWISSNDWMNTKYYPSLYNTHTSNTQFIREIAYVPWLENKLIDISFFTDNSLILPSEANAIQEMLYNQLRLINARLIVKQREYLTNYSEDYQNINQQIINNEASSATLYSDVDSIYQFLQSDQLVCFGARNHNGEVWLYWPKQATLYAYGQAVTKESLRTTLASYLYCPELESSTQTNDLTPQLSLQEPFTMIVNNQRQYWYLFNVDNTSLQYNGYANSNSTKDWRLVSSIGSVSANNICNFIIPDWCTSCVVYLGQTGPTHPLKIYFEGSGTSTQVRCQVYQNGWGPIINITTTPTTIQNFGTIYHGVGDSHRIYCDMSTVITSHYFGVLAIQSGSQITWSGANAINCTVQINSNTGVLQFVYPGSSSSTVSYTVRMNRNTSTIKSSSVTINAIQQSTGTVDMQTTCKTVTTTGEIEHLRIIAAPSIPMLIYGHCAIGSYTYETNTITVTRQNATSGSQFTFDSPQFFNGLYNSSCLTQSISSTADVLSASVDHLNQLCGLRESYAQLLGRNVYEIWKLWNTDINNTFTVGQTALKFQDVSVLDSSISDEIVVGQPYYSGSTELFTQDDVDFLRAAIGLSGSAPLMRTNVVSYIASLYTSITEKWTNCYNAAMSLGLYWPQDWNNSKWLLKHPSQASVQTELIDLLSPLIPTKWNNYTVTDLSPNLQLFPVKVNTKTDTIAFIPNNRIQIYDAVNMDRIIISGNMIATYNSDTYTATSTIVLTPDRPFGSMSVNYNIGYSAIIHTYYFNWDLTNNYVYLTCLEASDTNSSITYTLQGFNYDVLKPERQFSYAYQFKDSKRVAYENWQSATDNTQLKPQLLDFDSIKELETENSYIQAYKYHSFSSEMSSQRLNDNLQLYSTMRNIQQELCNPSISESIIPAQILALPFIEADKADYYAANYKANPVLYNIYSLAKHPIYDTSEYYNYLQQHDELWRSLYRKYPGIFRESNYANETATNSQELYQAAKRELESICRPSYEYSLTGMDIYMHDSDYIPTRIKLGEQIRIDYQDKDQITDTLNAAIREPLYITGISHTLRNDGDYQFTVTTRTATDSMVQRFAQLLSLGR